jgi:hypothetical protein
MRSSQTRARSRRAFLHELGSASTAAAALVVAPVLPARAYDPGSEERRPRYRASDDVKAFYRTNGYETLKK